MPFREWRNSVNDGNLGDLISGTATTTSTTPVVLQAYGTQSNSVTYFRVHAVGRRTDGASNDGAAMLLTALYKNIGGVMTQIGTDISTVIVASASVNTSALSTATSGSAVSVRVAGVAGTTISWTMQSSFVVYSL